MAVLTSTSEQVQCIVTQLGWMVWMMCESLVTVEVGGMCLQECIQVPGSMQCHPFNVGGVQNGVVTFSR